MGFCQDRRYGHFGDPHTVRSHVDGEEQRQGALSFVGLGYLRLCRVEQCGLQLRGLEFARHALAFPAEPVPLYRLFEFPDSFLRAFHRLFQDKRQRGLLHYHAGFHRLHGYGVGSGVQGMFQSRCQLVAIL